MSLQTRISIACAIGRAPVRDKLPAPLHTTDLFSALPAVSLWITEMRNVSRWLPDRDIEGMVEQLRVDAAKWPVFDWRNARARDGPFIGGPVHSDIAQREADLAAQRRDQEEKEKELDELMLDLAERDSSAELLDYIRRLASDALESQTRADNVEFVLATAHKVRENMMRGATADSVSIIRQQSEADVVESCSSVSATDCQRTVPAIPLLVPADRVQPVPSPGVCTETFSNISTVDSQLVDPSRPRTPTTAAGRRKQSTQVPGSGRRREKRKSRRVDMEQRGNAATDDASAARSEAEGSDG